MKKKEPESAMAADKAQKIWIKRESPGILEGVRRGGGASG
jgi:hypothetical protein